MNAANVSEELVDLTANTTEFQEEDVVLTLVILEDIVHNLADLNEVNIVLHSAICMPWFFFP